MGSGIQGAALCIVPCPSLLLNGAFSDDNDMICTSAPHETIISSDIMVIVISPK